MGQISEDIMALRPVTFRYRKHDNKQPTPQFGLIAEDVAEINPDLVVRDAGGEPLAVRYEAVNAMLLNEFLKEHRRVQEQETTIAQLKKDMENVLARLKEHDSKIQQVTDHIELSESTQRVVTND